jgi:hypothetical protein
MLLAGTGSQRYFGKLPILTVRDISAPMSVAQEIPVMITCPNQHELWVKVATATPPQPQPVRCPLCDEAQDVLLPRITKIEVL